MLSATAAIADIVQRIEPLDHLERDHIDQALDWLARTDDIYRRVKPAVPDQHMVSYGVLIAPEQHAVFLGAYRHAGLHLPMGGHLEPPSEPPLDAARREAREELGIAAEFSVICGQPLFVKVIPVGSDQHQRTAVSLWYVMRGHRQRSYTLDASEFAGGRWWDIDPKQMPDSDPHLGRFLTKFEATVPVVCGA